MANGTTHAIVGGLAGAGVALLKQRNETEHQHNPVVGLVVGTVFGKLPDILEPSLNNPHHRQFCHSVAVFTGIGYGLKKLYDWKPENDFDFFLRFLGLAAGAGYISHLILDATTARSLPLLGKI